MWMNLWRYVIHLEFHHPFDTLVLLVLLLLVAYNARSYLKRQLGFLTIHKRPYELLTYAATVLEIVHQVRGCS